MTSGRRPALPWAHFDDLRAGTAVRCPSPRRVLVAERPEEVLDVLTQVERATDAGEWAFGYVAYEAAAGLDPRLAVHGSTPMGMPLAWFGLCDEPVPVPRWRQPGRAPRSRPRPPDGDPRGRRTGTPLAAGRSGSGSPPATRSSAI